jgi:S-DNA-T family DNA segregation ATPase FtsK/SpoIIIE
MAVSQPKNSSTSLLKKEVLGLVFLGISLFLYLSLFSYNPKDPSFFSSTTNFSTHNWGGFIGAYLSDLLINLFGVGAYFIGLYFIGGFIYFLIRSESKISKYSFFIYLVFITLVSIFLQLVLTQFNFNGQSLAAGGLIGGALGKMGETYLGWWGCLIVIFLGAWMSLVWSLQLSLKNVLVGVGVFVRKAAFKIIEAFKNLISKFKTTLQNIKEKRLEKKEQKLANKKEKLKINTQIKPKPILDKKIEKPISPMLDDEGEPKIFNKAPKPKAKSTNQLSLQNLSRDYELPPVDLLDNGDGKEVVVDENSLKMNAKILEKKLNDFNVEGNVTEIHPGPVITMYEFQPAPGIKLSKISNLVDDLSLAMGGRSVRIVAPLPNKPAVGIEIPNTDREVVWFKDIISDPKFQKNRAKLLFALGKDIEGISYYSDLAKMPHLLVAGATGAGKSVSINTMIMSILFRAGPEDVRMLMIDPKMLELSIYEGIPHLLLPVVTDPKKANLTLKWGVKEMERRYKHLADINARNINDYNERVESRKFTSKQAERLKRLGLDSPPNDEDTLNHDEKLPYIVIIVDELADLMMVAGRDIEESIGRLAQMARAAGIHLILATQRPSVDVLTGVIKANFPSRIAFKVSSKHDSRTILDRIGAERLLGMGDMLFLPPGTSQITRAHGAFVNDGEVSRVVDYLKKQGKPIYDESILESNDTDGSGLADDDEDKDELYDQAVALVADTKQASISMVQRRLRVGYNRAARMIEQMEKEGIVSAPQGSSGREVLISSMAE